MFEEWIAQANSMVSRLKLEKGLSPSEIESLPPAKRVPIVEIEKWMQRVRARIAESFSADTVQRLEDISSINSGHLGRTKDSPAEQSIIWIERIVELLGELEQRAAEGKEPPRKCTQTMSRSREGN